MQFEVQILGSNSAVAEHGRHPTAQVVYLHEKMFLVDCGEGTQLRMQQFKVKRFRIQHIFISHLHGDHYFGLIGLITTYHLLRRNTPLTIYGPPELEKLITWQLGLSSTTLCYPLTFVPVNATEKMLLLDDNDVTVYSFPVKHRIPTTGFIFREKASLRKIKKEAVQDLALDPAHFIALREGKDIVTAEGKAYKNADLTLAALPPRTYVFCSDTLFDPTLADLVQGANMLYHEATFMDEHAQRAAETYHSTSVQAATMAQLAGVQELLIGHFSSKYIDLEPLLAEAKGVFPSTCLAEEGKVFQVPHR